MSWQKDSAKKGRDWPNKCKEKIHTGSYRPIYVVAKKLKRLIGSSRYIRILLTVVFLSRVSVQDMRNSLYLCMSENERSNYA